MIDSLTSSAEKYLAAVAVALGFQVSTIDAGAQNTAAAPFAEFLLVLGPVIPCGRRSRSSAEHACPEISNLRAIGGLKQLDTNQVDEHTINRSVGHLYLKMRDGIRVVNERRAKAVRIALGLIISRFFSTVAGQIILKFMIGGQS